MQYKRYYTVSGSNVTKVISLSLGLTVGILLSQIAFELSYEKCYPEAGNLGIVRAYYHNLETGEWMGGRWGYL